MKQDSKISLIRFKHLEKDLFPEIAELHIKNIPTGFISSLGPKFISQLYRGIAACPSAFCLVALEDNRVLGFIAGEESIGKLYKSVILRRGLFMLEPLLRFAFSPRTIRKIFQTLLYPSRTSKEYPSAEILSVVVAPDARRRGIGGKLMQAALQEFRRRGVPAIKLIVAADNEPANQYYLKEGFEKAGVYDSHGVKCNIYVRQLRDVLTAVSIDRRSQQKNAYALWLKEQGDYVVTVEGVDWYDYGGFMVPAYLPYRYPRIDPKMARRVVQISGRPFARWSTQFGQVDNSQWWFVLKRGPWAIDHVKDKKKRWMIRKSKKSFTVRPLADDEVVSQCPSVAQSATARYQGHAFVETCEILQKRISAAQKIPGVLEYLGCFYKDTLVSFSENYVQGNAVWLAKIRHDPAFLNKYSSYGLMDGILDYYLNAKRMDYVLDGCRSIYHRTQFQNHLIRTFAFTKEYAILNVVYSPRFKMALTLAYPFRHIVWALCNKWLNNTLEKISGILKQESIRTPNE